MGRRSFFFKDYVAHLVLIVCAFALAGVVFCYQMSSYALHAKQTELRTTVQSLAEQSKLLEGTDSDVIRQIYVLDQYTMPGLEPLTKFGVFKARFNDVLTDSMRALKLEAEGYKVSVVEYISPLDTPKNLLIRATRTGKVNHRAKAEYDAVRRTLGTTSELDRRCAELDNEFFVTDEDLMG